MAEPGSRGEVVIVGGGVAALETLMALRDLAPDAVSVTLVAAEPDFVYRPMSVAEPFGLGEARRYPLQRVVDDFGAALVRAGVAAVDAPARRIVLRSGDTIGYDTLVLAPGARMLPAFDTALTFGGPQSGAAMRALLDELEAGSARRFAFVVPTVVGWALPLYELALLTASRFPEATVGVVTTEPRPAAVFGAVASREVHARLTDARIDVHAGVLPETVEEGTLWLAEGGSLGADLVVALPQPDGPAIPGLPADAHGFLPVDRYGRVNGTPAVWAAGDATARPLKQGGLAAQQADVAARSIAAVHGGHVAPVAYEPALRGVLLTGGAPRFLRRSSASSVPSAASARPLWSAPGKVADSRVARYLAAHERFRVAAAN